jgi:hypothetical protein
MLLSNPIGVENYPYVGGMKEITQYLKRFIRNSWGE